MEKIQYFPVGHKQADWLNGKNVQLVATWKSGEMPASMPVQAVTTYATVIRVWIVDGETVWTCEKWQHDNGYRADFEVISKAKFLEFIR